MEPDDAEGLPSKLRRELAIQRTNLLGVCRLGVLSLNSVPRFMPAYTRNFVFKVVVSRPTNWPNACQASELMQMGRFLFCNHLCSPHVHMSVLRIAPLRMCVKSLVDKAAIEPISDGDTNLHNFCNVVEHIMLHRNEGV